MREGGDPTIAPVVVVVLALPRPSLKKKNRLDSCFFGNSGVPPRKGDLALPILVPRVEITLWAHERSTGGRSASGATQSIIDVRASGRLDDERKTKRCCARAASSATEKRTGHEVDDGGDDETRGDGRQGLRAPIQGGEPRGAQGASPLVQADGEEGCGVFQQERQGRGRLQEGRAPRARRGGPEPAERVRGGTAH